MPDTPAQGQKPVATFHDQRPHVFRSALRALLLLDRVERSRAGKRLGELSAELGINKSTVFRLLETLSAERVVVKDANTGRYASDLSSWAFFVESLRPANSLISSVQTVLDTISQSIGATCLLALPELGGRAALRPMYAVPDTSLYFDPGGAPETSPLHAAAAGKCYLANLPKEELDRYLDSPLASVTDRTIASPSALRRELGRVRRQGYALNQGESHEGTSAVAVPLRAPAGATVGGLALAFAGADVDAREARRIHHRLEASAQQVSSLLTYRSWLGYVRQTGAHQTRPQVGWDTPDPGVEEDGLLRVRTVARMVRLTAFLFNSPEGVSVAEVIQHRGLAKPTAWRLLNTLSSAGLLWQDAPEGRYRISPLFWLARAAVLGSATSREAAIARVLTGLAEAVGETACIGVPARDGRALSIPWHALPTRPICWRPRMGPVGLLHTTASGKCYLAAQPKRRLEQYLGQGLPATTDKSITTREQLVRELEDVRRHGYALNRGETTLGTTNLGVPLLNQRGATIGGLSVVSATTPVTPAQIDQWLPLLREAADGLSKLLAADWRELVSEEGSPGEGV